MKGWRLLLPTLLLLGVLGVAACSRGIPQEQYDKAGADLAAAQEQAKSLQAEVSVGKENLDKAKADLAAVQAQVKSLQTEVSAGKENLDKTKADLAAVQAQVKSLQTEVSAGKESLDKTKADLAAAQAQAQAQVKSLQAEVSAGKENLDKARADLAQARTQWEKAQGTLNAAQPYAKVMDLLIESQRQEAGLKPRYWQYSQDYVQSEREKAIKAAKDTTLDALAQVAFAERDGGSDGWRLWVYIMAAITDVLKGEGVPTAVIAPAPTLVASPTGETAIRVKLLQVDGKPIANVEVNLWVEDAPLGSPNAGVARTDASGIAIFRVAPGDYRADFNRSAFPAALIVPMGRSVTAQRGMTTEVEIRVFTK